MPLYSLLGSGAGSSAGSSSAAAGLGSTASSAGAGAASNAIGTATLGSLLKEGMQQGVKNAATDAVPKVSSMPEMPGSAFTSGINTLISEAQSTPMVGANQQQQEPDQLEALKRKQMMNQQSLMGLFQ